MAIAWRFFGALTLAGVLVTGLAAQEGGGGRDRGGRNDRRGTVRPGRPGRPIRPSPRRRPRAVHVFAFHGFGLTEKSHELARLHVWSVPDVWNRGGAAADDTAAPEPDPANPDCSPASPGYPECVGGGGGGIEPPPGVVSSDDDQPVSSDDDTVSSDDDDTGTSAPGAEPGIAPTPVPPPRPDEPVEKKGRRLIGVLRLGTSNYLVGGFKIQYDTAVPPATVEPQGGTTRNDPPERLRKRILGFEATLFSRPPMVEPAIGRPDGSRPAPVRPAKVGTIALARDEKTVGRGEPQEIVAGKAQIEKTAWRFVGHGRGRWAPRMVPVPPPGVAEPGPGEVMPMPATVSPSEVPGSTGSSVNEGF